MTKITPKDILKGRIKNAHDETKTELDKLVNKERLKKLINEERLAKFTNEEIVYGLIYQVNRYKKDKALFFFMKKLIDNDMIEVNNNPRFIKLIEKLEKVDKKIDESVVTDTIDNIISYERSSECRSDTLHKSTNNVVGEVINGNEQVNDTPYYVIKVKDIINHTIDHTPLHQKGSIDL